MHLNAYHLDLQFDTANIWLRIFPTKIQLKMRCLILLKVIIELNADMLFFKTKQTTTKNISFEQRRSVRDWDLGVCFEQKVF